MSDWMATAMLAAVTVATGTDAATRNASLFSRRATPADVLGAQLACGNYPGRRCGSAYSNQSALPWAEIFDPANRTFSPTGAMNVPRHGHAAVALADGRVLVTGGWRAGYVEATATAEVWDPATGAFALTGPMTLERAWGICVVVLSDGQVLLLGDTIEGEFGMATAPIDIFDPRTLTFTRWGEMSMSRAEAGVHWLDDGRLLVFGGAYRCCAAPGRHARSRSQEIIDLAARTAHRIEDLPTTLDGTEQPFVVAEHGSYLVTSEGGEPLQFAGSWRRLSQVQADPLVASRAVLRLTPDIVLARSAGVAVLDLRDGSSEEVLQGHSFQDSVVTLMSPGHVLVSGGERDDRCVCDAWPITAE